jgi:hypothetical protein
MRISFYMTMIDGNIPSLVGALKWPDSRSDPAGELHPGRAIAFFTLFLDQRCRKGL